MSDRELRCKGNKLFGIVVDGKASGILEVRCNSQFCGKRQGVVVLHHFDLDTGDLDTRRYREPPHTKKEG